MNNTATCLRFTFPWPCICWLYSCNSSVMMCIKIPYMYLASCVNWELQCVLEPPWTMAFCLAPSSLVKSHCSTSQVQERCHYQQQPQYASVNHPERKWWHDGVPLSTVTTTTMKSYIQCILGYPNLDYPNLDYLNLDYLNPRLSELTKACKFSWISL